MRGCGPIGWDLRPVGWDLRPVGWAWSPVAIYCAPMKLRAKIAATALLLPGCVTVLGGCGSQGIQLAKSNPYYRGAVLFRDHCSGCHTLSVVGAEGSATTIKNRVKTNGPNFDHRKENVEQVLYAIRNGGFSGAIMPENVVVGEDAQAVAAFLAEYSGREAEKVPSVNITLSTK
jgi:mono/diheme cytochrome c family protein